MRHTGLNILGDVPWGTHFCQFYDSRQDLIDILVPYFKAGLENNEFCMWVTSEPLHAEEAKAALAAEVPEVGEYLRRGQLEILDYSQWYVLDGKFDAGRVLEGWVDRVEAAIRRGFDGLRLTGNTFWLEKPDWQGFTEYEATVDRVIGRYPMLALCTYSLARCGAIEVIDVVSNHAFALIKQSGQWQMIQSAERKRIEATLQRERRVLDGILEATDVMLVYLDPNFNFVAVNPAYAASCRMRPEDMIGKNHFALYPDAENEAIFRRVRDTGEPVFYKDKPFVFPDQPERGITYWDWSLTPVKDHSSALIGLVFSLRETTRYKQAENAVRESEERYRSLFSNMSEGFALHEILTDERGRPCDYRFLDVNPSFERLTGLKRAEVLGKRVREVLPGIELQWIEAYGKVALTGEPVRFEHFAGPLQRQYEVFAYSPAERQFAVVFVDISARKRAEEALQQQREWLRVTLTSMGDAVIATDKAGRITFLNPVAAELTGWTEGRALGQPIGDVFRIIDERTHEAAEDIVGRVLQEGRVFSLANHTALVTRDGLEVPIEDSAAPIRDSAGNVAGAVLVFHDVTEKRRAQQELVKASEQRRLALQAAGLGAFDYRLDTGEVFWDERCRRMFGLPEGDHTRYTEAMDRIHPEDRPGFEEAVRRAMGGANGGAFYAEFRVLWSDGSVHWVASHGRAYFDEQAERRRAERFVGITMDVTERRQAEQRLRQAQKLESLGVLAGGIAHDFNNLLTSIMGTTSLVMDAVAPEIAGQLQNVVSSAERAAHLTQQLLAYAGKGQFIVRDLSLTPFVREMADLLRLSIPKSVELRLDLQDGLPVVRMDPGQLQQVIMNLVMNAGEAIGDRGRGKLSVVTGLDDVVIPFTDALGSEVSAGRYVYVEVSDNGPGIDEAAKARIFEPFFTTKFTGRGLGLAAISGIVRSQKGALRVESQPGQGSTFRVSFPAARTGDREAPGQSRRGTILVVDDEASVRAFVTLALRKHGYRVLEACDGSEALTFFDHEQEHLDLLILDIVMPIMGGHELLPEVMRRRPELKVILTSGYGESEVRRLCASYADAVFIQKPFTARTLTDMIETVLHASRQAATGAGR